MHHVLREEIGQGPVVAKLHQQAPHDIGAPPGSAVFAQFGAPGPGRTAGIGLLFNDKKTIGPFQFTAECLALYVLLHEAELHRVDEDPSPVLADNADSLLVLRHHLDGLSLPGIKDAAGLRVGEFHHLKELLRAIKGDLVNDKGRRRKVP